MISDCNQDFEFKSGEVEKYIKLSLKKMVELVERFTVEIHLDTNMNQYENFDVTIGKRNKAVVFVKRKTGSY